MLTIFLQLSTSGVDLVTFCLFDAIKTVIFLKFHTGNNRKQKLEKNRIFMH